MGVPKFYRWISERYPCLSEVVKEHQVPEFDNLYLDMNGIIHNCSHPNDDDPHFRITEEQIFSDIFRYIEVLFRIIRPCRTFFMAVDGVAPRAKMNQQRGRRFRSAKDAEERDKLAVTKGEVLPTEKRFDSNCITPGTKFMEKLQTQLEYFVKSKVTHDRAWQGVEIYLSGHQTPGEGEHKITEFIRYQRSQPGYDPNTRHCLYGLDADLMMLALCSHEPHFALLREEVRFTKRKNDKRTGKAEETTFHLLHISLMREYIDHEFEALKQTLPFPYNLESIIDDWVLMGFLVGNDFIPHLPNLHIASNALPLLYQTYISVLPKLDGYLNEDGVINLKRFQLYLESLSSFDEDHFEEIYEDYKWLESRKTANKSLGASSQDPGAKSQNEEKSIKIVKELAVSQGVYSDNDSQEDANEEELEPFYREFKQHKRHYYSEKFHVTPSNEQIHSLAFEYILGIQWICHYYYNGVQSWGWYYPYHYSPFVTDLLNVSEMKLKYKLNKPFLPYEQLLAVLPEASKDCIPDAYWHLMDEDSSEIGDFYPTKFSTDLNGKKQEWEAVVLIPFIDERRLLEAMEPCLQRLSKEERVRNQHGPCQLYVYDRNASYYLKSTLPGVFPDIAACFASRKDIPLTSWSKFPLSSLIKGLLPGCDLSVYYQGFPTLYHLPHTVNLRKQAVKVFQAPSRNENMILRIQSGDDVEANANNAGAMLADEPLEETAQRLLGKSVFVNWPHMEEAKVVALSNGTIKFCLDEQVTKAHGSHHQFVREELSGSHQNEYHSELQAFKERALGRRGIEIGETPVLLYAQILLGCKYVCGKRGEITLEKQWALLPQAHPIQATVKDLSVKGPTFEKMQSVFDLFPKNAEVFHLSLPHYGCMGRVVRVKDGVAVVTLDVPKEPDLRAATEQSHRHSFYNPGFRAAKTIGISPYLFSRLTGSIYIYFPAQQKWNIGLNLKFTRESCGIAGFTKRKDNAWYYSNALIDVMQLYLQKYPEVFRYLDRVLTNNSENMLKAEDIFESENTLEKLTRLSEFLKSLPCANGRKIHEMSSVVDRKAINAVNSAVSSFKNTGTHTKLELQLGIRPDFLYRPMTQQGNLIPDKEVQHYLMDRVVSVRMGYTVPLGYRGTVIGIHMEGEMKQDVMLDVLFDDEFLGGLTLGDLCPERRGYKLPVCAIINLSHGERLMKRQSNRPVAVVKPHHQQQNFQGVNMPPSQSPMNDHPARGQLTHSPYSAFSPTRRSLFRPNGPPPNSAPSSQRRSDSPNVHTVKTSKKLDTSSGNFVRNTLRNVLSQSPSENKPMLLDEAARKLPTVRKPFNQDATSVRTMRVPNPAPSHPPQRGKLAIHTQVSLEEAKSKSAQKQPLDGDKVKSSEPVSLNTEQLSGALKSVLKIADKAATRPVQQRDDNDQLNKILATLKVSATQSPTKSPHHATHKPFSLKDFLASNPTPTYGGMYPMYDSPTALLRPENLQALNTNLEGSSNPRGPTKSGPQGQTPNKKEGAEKLWELLNINNEEEKLNESLGSPPTWPDDDKKAEIFEEKDQEDFTKTKSDLYDAEDKLVEVSDVTEVEKPPSSPPPDAQLSPQAGRLLRWCQQHGAQPPLYTYCNLQPQEIGLLLCTVQLWDGQNFTSSPQTTKQDAKEGAASQAISHLENRNADMRYQPPSTAPTLPPPVLSYPSYSVRDVSIPVHGHHYIRDGKSVVPPQYVMRPPPMHPQFAVARMPPPPVNFMPMTADGMMLYPPPPMMTYPYQLPQRGIVPPYLSSVVPPTAPYVLPTSSPSHYYPPPAVAPQLTDNSGQLVATSIPFIPSQVVSQQFASRPSSGVLRQKSNPSVNPQQLSPNSAPQPYTASPTSVKTSGHSGKKPKGKLAISFGAKPK